MPSDEFSLIELITRRADALRTRHSGNGVILGIGDDAALLQPPPGHVLAVTSDVLNVGIHFPANTPAMDIGWKALAVNLSDLAAMGAAPAWCTLALSLPEADADWLAGFLDGFLALAEMHELTLVGGDTTRGPLSVAVTAHGWVEPQAALRRDAAQAGDDIWVTGTLGDAAAALACWQHGIPCVASLRARLNRPTPQVVAGLALSGLAHACIDISDGLVADLGHICRASTVAADIWLPRLPSSPELTTIADARTRWRWQASGGDDYELCFTAARAAREKIITRLNAAGVAATRIGSVHAAAPEVYMLDADGNNWQPEQTGFVHFKYTNSN